MQGFFYLYRKHAYFESFSKYKEKLNEIVKILMTDCIATRGQ